MTMNNFEVRTLISKKRLKYSEIAKTLGIATTTLAHWMTEELDDSKKKMVIKAIRQTKP